MPRCQLYYNIHKRLFSVRDKKTRKVIAHVSQALLANCTFHVSEAGRQRVLREKKKNVHAYIEGDWDGHALVQPKDWTNPFYIAVGYNPYKVGHFCQISEASQLLPDKPIRQAQRVFLTVNANPRINAIL